MKLNVAAISNSVNLPQKRRKKFEHRRVALTISLPINVTKLYTRSFLII